MYSLIYFTWALKSKLLISKQPGYQSLYVLSEGLDNEDKGQRGQGHYCCCQQIPTGDLTVYSPWTYPLMSRNSSSNDTCFIVKIGQTSWDVSIFIVVAVISDVVVAVDATESRASCNCISPTWRALDFRIFSLSPFRTCNDLCEHFMYNRNHENIINVDKGHLYQACEIWVIWEKKDWLFLMKARLKIIISAPVIGVRHGGGGGVGWATEFPKMLPMYLNWANSVYIWLEFGKDSYLFSCRNEVSSQNGSSAIFENFKIRTPSYNTK